MADYMTISGGAQNVREISPGNSRQSTREANTLDKGPSFGDTFKKALGEVNNLQKEADTSMQKFVTGQENNIHDVMIKAEKADIALRLMVQVRNKIIDAYQEIMKMQV